jgi:dephospho-CoA kinase
MTATRRWQGPQRRIGLTGGIATGKSSVGQLLVQRGLPLLDADVYAREALAPGSPGESAVQQRYGDGVRGPSGDINRVALAQIVFGDGGERRWLEGLVHPIVRRRLEDGLQQHAGAATVVLMIPLLFEAGLEGLCSEVWLVDCDEAQQLERLMARNGLSTAEAQTRVAAQWPLTRKRPLATVVIDNRGQPNALAAQVDQALRQP